MVVALFCALALCGITDHWTPLHPTPSDYTVTFTLALEQRNLPEFDAIFQQITTPGNPRYGQWLTIEQVNQIIAPSVEEQNQVLDYLTQHGCSGVSYGDFIVGSGPASAVNQLFSVEFYEFLHNVHDITIHRSTKNPRIPRELQNIVQFVTGISTFPFERRAREDDVEQVADDYWVVPQTLRAQYQIPANSTGTNPQNSMAVVEFGLVAGVSQNDLDQFNQLTDGDVGATLAYTVGNFAFTPISPIDGESTLDVQYIMAVAPGVPCSFWTIDGWVYDFTTLVQQRQSSGQPVPWVFSMSYAWSEYQQCEVTGNGASCAQVGGSDDSYVQTTSTNFQKLGATGLTLLGASGDAGAASKANVHCTNQTYPVQAEFPAASPYITAVGGTMFSSEVALTGNLPPFCTQNAITCSGGGTEIVSSCATGALITSGGGFSGILPAQSYQSSAVSGWLNGNYLEPPSQYWDSTGRGSPDVAGLAHRYMIVENGKTLSVDGTSASTPVTAGIIALINDARLNAGKSTVGFINPAIYAMSASNFHDVVTGNNTATEDSTRGYCTTYGYGAAPGWDPCTGRGTPNYNSWLSYWLSN